MILTKNVPVKALSGFANKGTEKIDLNSSAGRMMAYYNKLSQSSRLLPYTFGEENGLKRMIHFSSDWIQMIMLTNCFMNVIKIIYIQSGQIVSYIVRGIQDRNFTIS